MSTSNTEDKLNKLFLDYNPTFKDGFAERVMQSIELANSNRKKINIEFYNIFKLVVLSGVAAILILIFSVYITEGSFSIDAFYGLQEYTPDEPIITMLNY